MSFPAIPEICPSIHAAGSAQCAVQPALHRFFGDQFLDRCRCGAIPVPRYEGRNRHAAGDPVTCNLYRLPEVLQLALHLPRRPLHSLQRAILLLLLAFLLKNLALYGQYFLTTFIEQQITMTMRKQYYARLMDQDLAYFFHRKSGELMSIGINDITALNTGLAESFNKLIRDPFTVIVFLILLLGISWQLTLAALVIAPITGLISSVVSFSLKRKSRRAQENLEW